MGEIVMVMARVPKTGGLLPAPGEVVQGRPRDARPPTLFVLASFDSKDTSETEAEKEDENYAAYILDNPNVSEVYGELV
jgi:hypothetical protein